MELEPQFHPDPVHKLYEIYHCCVDSEKLLSPKHVEFHSKNTFEKLVHLVGFIIRRLHSVYTPTYLQKQFKILLLMRAKNSQYITSHKNKEFLLTQISKCQRLKFALRERPKCIGNREGTRTHVQSITLREVRVRYILR